ncbi:MAG: glutathione S-transferase C-terminal domain-containing protein [Pseudomonadota bacterium]
MGSMVAGVWYTDEGIKARPDGEWTRAPSILRHWITPDGAPGPTGDGGFAAEAGRYHIYVAPNCPWAHRALLTIALKNLGALIAVSFAAPKRTDQGWVFDNDKGYMDGLFGSHSVHELYSRGADDYTGRVTVPVLWDTKTDRIVSNESADIVRMLGSAFNHLGANDIDLYPQHLRGEIDAWNERIYRDFNNGVYRAGFSESQEKYDAAVKTVFETVDALEQRLENTNYIVGDQLTEVDVRLFPTLARFDVAYFSAFKCNIRRLTDYPNLWRYARRFFAMDGVKDTVYFDIYRRGYHSQSEKRNPFGIAPAGPVVDWSL